MTQFDQQGQTTRATRTILAPLSEELHADGPIAILQALITAYQAGGAGPQEQKLAGLLSETV